MLDAANASNEFEPAARVAQLPLSNIEEAVVRRNGEELAFYWPYNNRVHWGTMRPSAVCNLEYAEAAGSSQQKLVSCHISTLTAQLLLSRSRAAVYILV